MLTGVGVVSSTVIGAVSGILCSQEELNKTIKNQIVVTNNNNQQVQFSLDKKTNTFNLTQPVYSNEVLHFTNNESNTSTTWTVDGKTTKSNNYELTIPQNSTTPISIKVTVTSKTDFATSKTYTYDLVPSAAPTLTSHNLNVFNNTTNKAVSFSSSTNNNAITYTPNANQIYAKNKLTFTNNSTSNSGIVYTINQNNKNVVLKPGEPYSYTVSSASNPRPLKITISSLKDPFETKTVTYNLTPSTAPSYGLIKVSSTNKNLVITQTNAKSSIDKTYSLSNVYDNNVLTFSPKITLQYILSSNTKNVNVTKNTATYTVNGTQQVTLVFTLTNVADPSVSSTFTYTFTPKTAAQLCGINFNSTNKASTATPISSSTSNTQAFNISSVYNNNVLTFTPSNSDFSISCQNAGVSIKNNIATYSVNTSKTVTLTFTVTNNFDSTISGTFTYTFTPNIIPAYGNINVSSTNTSFSSTPSKTNSSDISLNNVYVNNILTFVTGSDYHLTCSNKDVQIQNDTATYNVTSSSSTPITLTFDVINNNDTLVEKNFYLYFCSNGSTYMG